MVWLFDTKETGRPELAVAFTVKVFSLSGWLAGAVKVMVCAASTVNFWTTLGAAA